MQIPKAEWPKSIDVSQFNNGGRPIDWAAVVPELKKLGVERVIVRASYGPHYEDPQFRHNWLTLKQLRFPKAAYHAAVPGQSPNLDAHAQQQSSFFLHLVDEVGGFQGDDWPILDYENAESLTPADLTRWAAHWLACVDAAVKNPKNRAILYTYVGFVQAHLALYDMLANRPLWIADYPGGTEVPTRGVPDVGGWTAYRGWQFTDKAQIPGIAGPVDLSVWVGEPVEKATSPETKGTAGDTAPPSDATNTSVAETTLEHENAALKATIAAAQKVLGETHVG